MAPGPPTSGCLYCDSAGFESFTPTHACCISNYKIRRPSYCNEVFFVLQNRAFGVIILHSWYYNLAQFSVIKSNFSYYKTELFVL